MFEGVQCVVWISKSKSEHFFIYKSVLHIEQSRKFKLSIGYCHVRILYHVRTFVIYLYIVGSIHYV